ncbi:HAMP domain-containing sensor histidine kinase [Tissierella sp.]|uniref:sensor histidine kinase n=1 Tax=Tissierella sp. TaxID=41274 RepID=UPI00285D37D8|nr:HAMP domain-containing sensor histidine kinase [Tissierella sp.]MDR7856539.1 HAMP domain-containing sensor histidine kinase [Tissierella sp.]
MKLSGKLTLSFTFIILVSIIIISFISNLMINNRFENYLVEEQQSKLQQIRDEINDLYNKNGYILYEREINSYASLENVYIEIRDLSGNILYTSTNRNGMGGMHRRMMRIHDMPEGNYVEKSGPLLEGDKEVGKLIIGYIDNAYLSESAIIFKDTLSKSFFVSAILTVLLGLIISTILSRSLTRPLLKIRDTATEIRKGNLNKKSNVNTNTIEILELSDSINYLGETLARQENIRKKYASNISHELRTPLTTLKSHLEAIMDGVWDPNEEHLDILMKEIDRLSNLVDDLKDSFRAEELEFVLNKTRFNISNELNDIIMSFIPLYNKKGFAIESSIEDHIEIIMDKDKLKQIMYNLLFNSIKYLDKDGKVLLELIKDKNNVIIRVIDNGIGIEKKDLPFVFDRFYRSDISKNKDTNGTGLGLSIVKSIVEAHNGTISIESIYGEVTKVSITLPLGF